MASYSTSEATTRTSSLWLRLSRLPKTRLTSESNCWKAYFDVAGRLDDSGPLRHFREARRRGSTSRARNHRRTCRDEAAGQKACCRRDDGRLSATLGTLLDSEGAATDALDRLVWLAPGFTANASRSLQVR